MGSYNVLPIEIFIVVMHATEEFGNEKMLKQLEALVDEFKLPSNITMQLLSLNSR